MNASLDNLIHAYLDGTATEAEVQELSALLEANDEARTRYLALSEVNAVLGSHETVWDQEDQLRFADKEPLRFEKQQAAWLRLPWLAAAAAVGFMLLTFWVKRPKPVPQPRAQGDQHFATDGPVTTPDESVVPLALLKQSSRVQWIFPTTAPMPGTSLAAGKLSFAEGSIHLEFLSGAQLIVQGPAELELDSDNSAWLHRGTATAHVPEPAQGFRLKTAGAIVEDLGTSFGLAVGDGKSSEVHVFDGEVDVLPDQGSKLRLTANNAIRLEATTLAKVPLRAGDFPQADKLAEEAAQTSAAELTQWQADAVRMSQDPSIAAFFPLLEKNKLPADTVAVGSSWAEGRWPGKSALQFRSRTDRLRFHVDGPLPAISLLAWVCVDDLSNDYNALIHPTHYANGSLHWTLERGGELRLTMLTNIKNPFALHVWDGPVSAPAIYPMDFGRWIFLATTYDSATGEVIHYRDGVESSRGTFTHRLPAQLGDVEFGNWGADGTSPDNAWFLRQPPHYRKRHFTGQLDTLAIYRRVLSAREISRMSSE